MTPKNEPVLPLIRAAAIEPAVCRRTAMVLAQVQDSSGGSFHASMATLAAWAGMSSGQTRKHVHSLINMGVLQVLANRNGGSSQSLPQYQFNSLRLRALGQQPGSTPDMFQTPALARKAFHATDERGNQVEMVIEIRGQPGMRLVRFVRPTSTGTYLYGQASLQAMLRPGFAKGAWTGWLNPHEWCPEWVESVQASPETVESLRQWAQQVALGRVESAVQA